MQIVGVDLPGRSWCGRTDVHVGVQRRAEVVDRFAADVAEVVWDFPIDVSDTDGDVDFRGPFVQGRRGERFVYLSWDAAGPDGSFQMFRRAKLMLASIDSETVRAAAERGCRLVGTLALTGDDRGPRCGTVRPPLIRWEAVAEQPA